MNVMKNTPGWIVRAITRNPGSEASQALVEQGLEVVQADYDDEESLARAFEVPPPYRILFSEAIH